MVRKIAVIVNPIAGMGGRVGLKGTDGVVEEAINRGAEPVAPIRAQETICEFCKEVEKEPSVLDEVVFLTCAGSMGEDSLRDGGITSFKIVYHSEEDATSAEDTMAACRVFLEQGVELVVFCGGDGTARNVLSSVGDDIPILGIPAGVKMHSGVFGVDTSAAAFMLFEFLRGGLTIGDAEVMDLDEQRYRAGEWNIRLYGVARGIVEPTYVQVGKTMYEAQSEDSIREELAEHIEDEMKAHPEVLYLFGSGGTIEFIAHRLGLDNTILGVDAVFEGRVVGKDLNEQGILTLLRRYGSAKAILSPIGSQGFILGRGNLQFSPEVIRQIGFDNLVVLSTPSKLLNTPHLRVDTGDKELDRKFYDEEFLMVVIGYRLSRVVHLTEPTRGQ